MAFRATLNHCTWNRNARSSLRFVLSNDYCAQCFAPRFNMFALIDGNNFYASCERVFQPELRHRPLIVLSNNDGCAIARSEEAKALGVAMGQPLHLIPKPIR